MVKSRLRGVIFIPPSMLLPEIFQWLCLGRVLRQLSNPHPNLLAHSIPPTDLYLVICPPGQILKTLSVFPASA